MIQVGKGTVVSIRYIMRISRGEVLENTISGPAASYLHGSSGILRSLQVQLEGLQEGERKQVYLLKDYDNLEEDFSFDVLVDSIRKALPQEITLGYPLTGTAMECGPGCACFY
jgi:FKBP-type peptidyl-prolyl cis-trans isomerase SlyD